MEVKINEKRFENLQKSTWFLLAGFQNLRGNNYAEKYESEYCDVSYIEEKNLVFVEWKKYCEFDTYWWNRVGKVANLILSAIGVIWWVR